MPPVRARWPRVLEARLDAEGLAVAGWRELYPAHPELVGHEVGQVEVLGRVPDGGRRPRRQGARATFQAATLQAQQRVLAELPTG